MADSGDEIRKLLRLFRKGHISEEMLLEQMAELVDESPADARAEHAAERDGEARRRKLIAQLDAYRAAEASGAETVASWAQISTDRELKGGLRAVAAREAAHVTLLEQRVRELGGEISAQIPDWLRKYNAAILDPDASDLDRLGAIVAQFPDPEEAVAPLRALASSLEDDDLSRSLLLGICEDELVTLRWVHEAFTQRSMLAKKPSGVDASGG
jgi:hypothetical protein